MNKLCFGLCECSSSDESCSLDIDVMGSVSFVKEMSSLQCLQNILALS